MAIENQVARGVVADLRDRGYYIGDLSGSEEVDRLFELRLSWSNASGISGSDHKRQRLVASDLKRAAQQELTLGVASACRLIDQRTGGLLSLWNVGPYDPQFIRGINQGSIQKIHSDTNYSYITQDGLRSLRADEVGVSGRGREFSLFITGPEGGRFCIFLPTDPRARWFDYGERLTAKHPTPELVGCQLYNVVMPPFGFCILFAGALHAGSDALPTRVFAFLRRIGRTRRCMSAYEQKTHYISEVNQPIGQRSEDLPDVSERA